MPCCHQGLVVTLRLSHVLLLCREDSAPVVPLTKEAIRNAQLSYVGSFKDPEVLKHWSGSGNLR